MIIIMYMHMFYANLILWKIIRKYHPYRTLAPSSVLWILWEYLGPLVLIWLARNFEFTWPFALDLYAPKPNKSRKSGTYMSSQFKFSPFEPVQLEMLELCDILLNDSNSIDLWFGAHVRLCLYFFFYSHNLIPSSLY